MAIALHRNQRRAVHRPPLMRHREGEPEAVLAALMLALLIGGVGFLVTVLAAPPSSTASSGRHWLARGAADRPREGTAPVPSSLVSVPAEAPSTPPPATTPAPEAVPDRPGLVVGGAARVAHTDGLGVVLHAAPSRNARLPAGLLEGTRVVVLDGADGEWVSVQTETQRTGWVPAAYLAVEE